MLRGMNTARGNYMSPDLLQLCIGMNNRVVICRLLIAYVGTYLLLPYGGSRRKIEITQSLESLDTRYAVAIYMYVASIRTIHHTICYLALQSVSSSFLDI
ncbi:hypothetical protein GGR54DRAFT_37670 [Hypoxylon sp. NC1633]|nr:hypothetical protein GGR54DRAFT_37670 [Hypoxylon sp. NC1633]